MADDIFGVLESWVLLGVVVSLAALFACFSCWDECHKNARRGSKVVGSDSSSSSSSDINNKKNELRKVGSKDKLKGESYQKYGLVKSVPADDSIWFTAIRELNAKAKSQQSENDIEFGRESQRSDDDQSATQGATQKHHEAKSKMPAMVRKKANAGDNYKNIHRKSKISSDLDKVSLISENDKSTSTTRKNTKTKSTTPALLKKKNSMAAGIGGMYRKFHRKTSSDLSKTDSMTLSSSKSGWSSEKGKRKNIPQRNIPTQSKNKKSLLPMSHENVHKNVPGNKPIHRRHGSSVDASSPKNLDKRLQFKNTSTKIPIKKKKVDSSSRSDSRTKSSSNTKSQKISSPEDTSSSSKFISFLG